MSVCLWCGSLTAVPGSTCPWAMACPRCGAAPGARCRRPSGHEGAMHAARWEEAEARDRRAGIVYGPETAVLFGET